jgi:hypothetical protein
LLTGLPQEMCRPGTSLFELFVFNAKRGDYGPGDAAAQASERIAKISRHEPREGMVDRADGRKILARYRPIAGGDLRRCHRHPPRRDGAQDLGRPL